VNTVNRAKLLESIASALHTQAGFDNQSTTTAAFYRRNGTFYLTHQYNKRYEELLLYAVSRLYRLSSSKMIRTRPDVSEALKKEIEAGESIKKKPFSDVVKHLLNSTVSITDEQDKEDFSPFLDEIQSVKVVLDSDLFIRSEQHSGFHGESRIVRFLYIKYLKRIPFTEMQQADQGTIGRFESDFKACYADSLFMGSSQGACTYCAEMMNTLGIRYDSSQGMNKDRNGTWRHPLTTTTQLHRYGPPVASTLLATNAVQTYGVHKGPKQVG
jgi:hypothetical protein